MSHVAMLGKREGDHGLMRRDAQSCKVLSGNQGVPARVVAVSHRVQQWHFAAELCRY